MRFKSYHAIAIGAASILLLVHLLARSSSTTNDIVPANDNTQRLKLSSTDEQTDDLLDFDKPVGRKEHVFVDFSHVNFTQVRLAMAKNQVANPSAKTKQLAGIPPFANKRAPAHRPGDIVGNERRNPKLDKDAAPPSWETVHARRTAMATLRDKLLSNSKAASGVQQPMIRVVVVHTHPASSVRQGSDARIAQVLQELVRLDCHVTFVYPRTESSYSGTSSERLVQRHAFYRQLGVHRVIGPVASYQQLLSQLYTCDADQPQCGCLDPIILQWPWLSPTYNKWLLSLTAALRGSGLQARIVTVFDNDHVQRASDEAALQVGKSASKRSSEEFSSLLRLSDHTMGISRAVNEYIAKELGEASKGNRPMLLPFGFDHRQDIPVHKSWQDSDLDVVYMAGHSGPNFASLQAICDTIAPQLGVYTIHVYGSISNARDKHCKSAPKNVKFYGYTSDEELDQNLARAKLFVAPIMVHTGVATKIVKAFQHGVAVITNHRGRDATPAPLDEHLLEVDVENMGAYMKNLLEKESGPTPVHLGFNSNLELVSTPLRSLITQHRATCQAPTKQVSPAPTILMRPTTCEGKDFEVYACEQHCSLVTAAVEELNRKHAAELMLPTAVSCGYNTPPRQQDMFNVHVTLTASTAIDTNCDLVLAASNDELDNIDTADDKKPLPWHNYYPGIAVLSKQGQPVRKAVWTPDSEHFHLAVAIDCELPGHFSDKAMWQSMAKDMSMKITFVIMDAAGADHADRCLPKAAKTLAGFATATLEIETAHHRKWLDVLATATVVSWLSSADHVACVYLAQALQLAVPVIASMHGAVTRCQAGIGSEMFANRLHLKGLSDQPATFIAGLARLQDKANFASHVLHEQFGAEFATQRLRAALAVGTEGGLPTNYAPRHVRTAFSESLV